MSEESFRMVIDATFLVKGRGTVVSGKVKSGDARKGYEVTLLSHQMKPLITTTIRGIVMPQYEDITALMNRATVDIFLDGEYIHEIAEKGMIIVSDKADRGSE